MIDQAQTISAELHARLREIAGDSVDVYVGREPDDRDRSTSQWPGRPWIVVGQWRHGPIMVTSHDAEHRLVTARSAWQLGERVPVTAYLHDRQGVPIMVYDGDAIGHEVYEPETRNQIGGLGASRPTPPTSEQIRTCVRMALVQINDRLHRLATTTTSDEVREFIARHKLSQARLAHLLGYSTPTVERWCQGTVEPPPPLWRALRDLAGQLSAGAPTSAADDHDHADGPKR